MRRTLLSLSLLSVLLAVPLTATAAPILYASTGGIGSNLYVIDVATGTTTLVGATGVDRMSGLDFDASGVLYGIAGGSAGPASLYTIDITTGAATLVGAVSGIQGADGLAFDSAGTLYAGGWSGTAGRLLTLDPATGAILTNIGMTGSGNDFVAGLDVDGANQLWGSRGNAFGSTEDLVTIDPTTGVQTAVGGNFSVISGIWFDVDGTLYAISTSGGVLTIDPITGTQTLLFNTGISNLSGLTGVVPEPSTLLLAATAAVVLRRRLRRDSSGREAASSSRTI